MNELNLDKNEDYNMTNINGYVFECDNMIKTKGIARTGMWIRDIFRYSRLSNSECVGESVIGVKIGFPKKRKFNVFGFYRQWSDTFNDKKCEPRSFKNQEISFRNQLEEIKKVSNIETIVLGDMNIDFRIINKNEQEKVQYEKSFNNMLESIKKNLLEDGFLQLVKENTRANKILDHVYSNCISKVHNSYVELSSTDHKFVIFEEKN